MLINTKVNDEMVVRVNNLPHFISSAIAFNSLEDQNGAIQLAGPGIK